MQVLHEPVAVRKEFCFVRKEKHSLKTSMFLGRGSKMLSFKSEDLPVIETVDHEDLVSAEETDENTSVTCFVRNSCLVREYFFCANK